MIYKYNILKYLNVLIARISTVVKDLGSDDKGLCVFGI